MSYYKLLNPVYAYRNRWRVYSRAERFACRMPARGLGGTVVSAAEATPLLQNRKRLIRLHNRHQGERAFIIGNGPSLLIEDLDKLTSEVTFASNKIYLAFEETAWRPSYYSVLDVLVAEQTSAEIDQLDLIKVFAADVRSYMPFAESVVWVPSLPAPIVDGKVQPGFSTDLVHGAFGGWTVIYLQLQIAFFMGIREVYLLGLDFSFNVPAPTGESSSQGPVLEHDGVSNHFHPNYRSPGEKWTMPRLDIQREAFVVARSAFEAHGGVVINASRKSALDVFELAEFDGVVNAGKGVEALL